MKCIQIVLLLAAFFITEKGNGQLWKEYSDSAKVFGIQKKSDSAVTYYLKAKEFLSKDSLLTSTYTGINNALAAVYSSTKQFEKAETLYVESKKINEKLFGKEHGDYARSCSSLAGVYVNLAKYDKAEFQYKEAMEIMEKVLDKNHPDFEAVCYDLGLMYYSMGQYQKIIPLWEKVKQIREKTINKESPEYSKICNNLGIVYFNQGQYEKAEPLYLEAKQIREKTLGKLHPDYASSLNNLAVLYKSMGQYDKAESHYLQVKEIREKQLGKMHPQYATICNNLGSFYELTGAFEKAESFYIEAKQIRDKVLGKNHPDIAFSCLSLGSLYMNNGFYEKAEAYFLEGKQIREITYGKEHPDYAAACCNLGILYVEIGLYKKAEPLYLEAKQIWEITSGKESNNYAIICNNLGVLYKHTGDYQQAEYFHSEAKRIREIKFGKEHPDYALSCNNLANLYSSMGQYTKSELYFLEAKKVREIKLGKEHPDYAHSCNNLADLYCYMGLYEKAEPLYLEALQTRGKAYGKQHPRYAESCNSLANLYTNTGQYLKAESLYIESKLVREKSLGKDHPDYANSCNNLATMYDAIGQYAKAIQLQSEAIQITEKVFGKEHPSFINSSINLAGLYWKTNDSLKAKEYYAETFKIQNRVIKKIFQFTSEEEKQSYLREVTDLDKLFLSFNLSAISHTQQDFAYNVVLSNRNLILSSSQQLRQAIFSSNDTSLAHKYNEWMMTREQLSFWLTKSISERGRRDSALEEKANTLEKDLTGLSSEFRKQQEKKEITWKSIRQKLELNEAAIEFSEFKYYDGKRYTDSIYYIALLLRKDKTEPEMIKLFEKKQLDSLLLRPGSVSAINALYGSVALYNLIWQPLEKHLGDISKVYFAAAGLLHKINLSAIASGNGQVLSDKYQLIQLNTTASVTEQANIFITPSDKIIMYGGVKFNADSAELKSAVKNYQFNDENSFALRGIDFPLDKLPELPFSELEVENIANAAKKNDYTIQILKGADANEESIKSLNGTKSPAVLHLSTHGKFFTDPVKLKPGQSLSGGKSFSQSDNPLLRSMLLLAGANSTWAGKPVSKIQDGVLTAYEISNLYLPNTKLVVLSACETGLGDIQGSEGVYGLQRAFKMAGVQNLIMSLWSVPDNTTAEFMELFYNQLFAKKSISDAFYISQKVMKDKYKGYPHKWAGLILVR